MKAAVISDLHVGSEHCNHAGLLRFLETLSDGETLVLNGDVHDRYTRQLSPAGSAVIDAIAAETKRRRVVWLEGNHDRHYRATIPEGIEYRRMLELPGGIIAAHGDGFSGILHYARPLTCVLRAAYRGRRLAAGEGEHVAAYAKRWPMLYDIVRKAVRRSAVAYAKGHGYSTVICGHSHYAEDVVLDGVRFINTGAWTETPVFSVRVDGAIAAFERVG